MSAIVHGNGAPIEQGYGLTIRRGANGIEFVRRWRGTPQAILAQAGSLSVDESISEINADHAPGSGVADLQIRLARLPGDVEERIEESLSLDWAESSEPIHRAPAFVNITSTRIKALDELAADSTSTAPTDATELKYFKLKQRGVTHYPVDLPVITYTLIAPRNTVERLDVSNSGKVFPAVDFDVSSFFVIDDINLGMSADSNGLFIVGWRLKARGDHLANGNSQLVETYTFGLYEADLYEVAA